MSKKDTQLPTVVFFPNGDEKVVNNDTDSNTQQSTKKINYFKWLVNSWAHPGENLAGSKWFGVTTIIGELVIFFGSLYAFFHKMLKNTMLDVDTIFNTLNGAKSGAAELLVYSKLLLYSLIAVAIILGGTYLINRYLVSGKKEDFWTFTNRIAHYSGLNVIFVLIILVLGLTGVAGRLISILTMLALLFFSIAILVAVVGNSNEEGLDKVYAGIVTSLVIGLGYFVFYLLASRILFSIISIGMSVFMQMMLGGQ